MKFQELVYTNARAEFTKWLVSEVERLAKLVIEYEPRAKSFCMAMGCVSFHCKWEECDELDQSDVWERDENLEPHELEQNSHALELSELFSRWDRELCISGIPMKINLDNVTGILETVTDW